MIILKLYNYLKDENKENLARVNNMKPMPSQDLVNFTFIAHSYL